MRKLAIVWILLLPVLAGAQTFSQMQLRHERVRTAVDHSDSRLRSMFKEAGVSYPPKYVYWRAFKTEKELELWASDDPYKPHKLIHTYEVCRLSGVLGFKAKEGDEQIPEGIYYIDRYNPFSNYFLSFRLSYPNGVDSFWGDRHRLGGQIYIHGECATIGCLPMTDSIIQEIYWTSVQAQSYQGFIARIPVHVFPFRPENKKEALKIDGWSGAYKQFEKRWANLFFAYHHFERKHFPAKGYHNKKGYYAFDTVPPRIPRKLTPIFWNPVVKVEHKSDTPLEMMRTSRYLKPVNLITRDYIIEVNRRELASKTNFILKSKYVEIKPKPGEWRPHNAPKRYKKVVDTVYVNLNP